MFATILSLLLSGAVTGDGPGSQGPSPAELERAHSLLAGSWEVVSIVDDGETIGKELIRAKLAKDGRIRVANRSFEIVNPETGDGRTSAFRLDPSKLPRQIDILSSGDRLVRGIYMIEEDGLAICLQQKDGEPRPASFDAPAGSGCMLLRMKLVKPAAPALVPAVPGQSKSVVKEDRKPTESEIKRVHELFSGNWDILGITEDGNELGPELIRQRFAQGGRVQFGTRGIAIVNPRSEERRITTYRVDPSKSPSQIDVTTQFDSVLRGIYKFEGDKLTVCLARHEDGARPTEFEARGGSDRALFQLQLSRPDSKPRPTPASPSRPAPAEESPNRAELARRMMIGSWTTTDLKGTFTIVFRPDGTFSATRIWSKSRRKLLGPASDTSEGDWRLLGDMLTAVVSSTTDKDLAGIQINLRVHEIGDTSMVVSDQFGTKQTLNKLR